jgi:hypothetical protein
MKATRRETLGWRRRGILLATAVGLPATRNISSYVSVVIVIIAELGTTYFRPKNTCL